jgi:hypothetical protein
MRWIALVLVMGCGGRDIQQCQFDCPGARSIFTANDPYGETWRWCTCGPDSANVRFKTRSFDPAVAATKECESVRELWSFLQNASPGCAAH